MKAIGKLKKMKQTNKAKRNTLRFFYPAEWFQFIGVVSNLLHIFVFELLLNTGLRIQEAKNIRVRDINLDRNYLTVLKSKTGKQRQVFFSTQFRVKLKQHIAYNKLQPENTLMIPSVQYLDRQIKKYCRKAGISNPEDFTCHTFRKTNENYLVAKNVNTMIITQHIGHTVNVATAYYVSQFLKPEEKTQIKMIIGDLFDSL